MELTGALSNPDTGEPLDRLGVLHARALANAQAPPVLQPPRRKPHPALKTIIRILEKAEGPMHAQEIHAVAEELLRASVCRSSLRDCLSTQTSGVRDCFARLVRGSYRPASPRRT